MGLYLSSKNGQPPTRQHLMTTLRGFYKLQGWTSLKTVDIRSFRIGAATTAAARKMEDSIIIDTWKIEQCHLFAICQNLYYAPDT